MPGALEGEAVTKADPDKLSWGVDSKTAVEIPTGQSQQRLKAIAKPELRWDEDDKTALVPVGAIIPAEAYRDAEPRLTSVSSTAPATEEVPPAVSGASAEPEMTFELRRGPATPSPPEHRAEALPSASPAQSPALPLERPRRKGRWLLPSLMILLAFVITYVAMSTLREMRAQPPGAAPRSVWAAVVKVLEDVRDKVK